MNVKDNSQTVLLHLDSSPRSSGSYSHQLTGRFVSAWQQLNPQANVLYRDIGRQPIPHVDEVWVSAYEAEPQQRTPAMQAAIELSDRLIDELMLADRYVFGIPMYNLTVSSGFKAYIDQVIRRDRTLIFENGKLSGALKQKKLLIITSRKYSYRADSGRADRDFLEPYLRAIFGVLGITDMTFIHADCLADTAMQQQILTEVASAIDRLVLDW